MFDNNGNITSNANLATRYVYNITMYKLISGKSSSNFIISKISTASTVKANYISQSTTPLSGNFFV
jgi:hypothetical protein